LLRRKSDYRFVDVGRIPVNGNFLPARDVMSKGGGMIPHAEDAACLLEMCCERFGNGNGVYTDEVYMMPSEDALWIAIHNLPYSVSWQRVFVDPDYEFSPIYDASSDSSNLYSQYPDAFSMTPATKDEALEGYGLARLCPMSIDTLRRAFYDYQRIVRFNAGYRSTENGSGITNVESWNGRWDDAADQYVWTKITTTRNTAFHRYGWAVSGMNYENADHWTRRAYVSDSSGSVRLTLNDRTAYKDYIDSAVAFVKFYTYFTDRANNPMTGNWTISEWANITFGGTESIIVPRKTVDIVPVECQKDGDGWVLPSSAMSVAAAKAALSRAGIDESPPDIEHPPDEYPTGATSIHKTAVVDMRVIGLVCKCRFPSDFSELEWGWEPDSGMDN